MNLSWGDVSKCLLELDRLVTADQSKDVCLEEQTWASLQNTSEGWPTGAEVTLKYLPHGNASSHISTEAAAWSPPFSQYSMPCIPWHLPRSPEALTGTEEVMARLPCEAPVTLSFPFNHGASIAALLLPKTWLSLYRSAYFVAMATGPR